MTISFSRIPLIQQLFQSTWTLPCFLWTN